MSRPRKGFIQDDNTGCWNWQGARHCASGYGRVEEKGVRMLAHRYFYIKAGNTLAADIDLRHKCHNTRCVNPAHLEPGSHPDNMLDMAKARRSGQAKLSVEQVKAIPGLRKQGLTMKQIGQRFGVTREAIREILKGRNYAWVK